MKNLRIAALPAMILVSGALLAGCGDTDGDAEPAGTMGPTETTENMEPTTEPTFESELDTELDLSPEE